VPGHTRGHIAYWFKDHDALFCGDTLFALGCGRLFEGTPQQMWTSLSKLRALPDSTLVYCAHEYTKATHVLLNRGSYQHESKIAQRRDRSAAAAMAKLPCLDFRRGRAPPTRSCGADVRRWQRRSDCRAPIRASVCRSRSRKDNSAKSDQACIVKLYTNPPRIRRKAVIAVLEWTWTAATEIIDVNPWIRRRNAGRQSVEQDPALLTYHGDSVFNSSAVCDYLDALDGRHA